MWKGNFLIWKKTKKWKEMNWIENKCKEMIGNERTWRTWIEMKGYDRYVRSERKSQDICGNEWK